MKTWIFQEERRYTGLNWSLLHLLGRFSQMIRLHWKKWEYCDTKWNIFDLKVTFTNQKKLLTFFLCRAIFVNICILCVSKWIWLNWSKYSICSIISFNCYTNRHFAVTICNLKKFPPNLHHNPIYFIWMVFFPFAVLVLSWFLCD